MIASLKQAPAAQDSRAVPGIRLAVIASRWNAAIVEVLVAGALAELAAAGVPRDHVDLLHVPGAWELPALAARLAVAGRHQAIIALGCVIRGETRHYEHVADGCAQGLMAVATRHALPVLNGVLAVEAEADALARAGGAHGNKGSEVARAALAMTRLWSRL